MANTFQDSAVAAPSRPFWKSLSAKQTRAAVVIGLSLGIAFGGLQILFDLAQERTRTVEEYTRILRTVEDTAFQSADRLDERLARRVVEGLLLYAAIRRAEILDDSGGTLAWASRPKKRGALTHMAEYIFGAREDFSQDLGIEDVGSVVGKLQISLDYYVIAHTFFARCGLVLLLGVLRNLLLAVILSVVFHHLLTRPLAMFLTGVRARQMAVPVPPEHADDDLGDLVEAYNHLTQSHHEVERHLRESEERFRAALESAVVGFVVVNDKGLVELFNPAAEQIFGYSADEAIGRPVELFIPSSDDAGGGSTSPDYLCTDDAKMIGTGREARGLHKVGGTFPIQLGVGEMSINGRRLLVASITDLTNIKGLESTLVQSQKLEALGQLTGGVAHDINNILAVILGNLELVRERVEVGDATRLIDSAIEASNRGAKLTYRLLAFARRQPLIPRVVDPGKVIYDMADLLRRSLGETIEIQFVIEAGLWSCKVDPSQLENMVLNLAVNARDAMPAGGRLTIEASNAPLDDLHAAAQAEVTPGQYVCLAVTDTGDGMDDEVVAKAFDPFYTTKEAGRGTGLGLSMAYGFVKQSGGDIKIHSEVGEGTTVRVYLQRSLEAMEETSEPAAEPGDLDGHRELVLVVEDDADLRGLVLNQLGGLGYKTLEAANGLSALEILRQSSEVALLLTDIVLPGGMSGSELADKASEIRAGLPTIFMSGYTSNAFIQYGRLREGVVLLRKPFRKAELARTLKAALQ